MSKYVQLPRVTGGRTDRITHSELASQVRQFERARRATGAREVEQDKPGLFRTVVDLLARFEYAEAGALEELVGGKGVGAAVGRAGAELFSGVGGLKGEKRGFGEVFERLGVGEMGRLDTLFPFLEDTMVGGITGRGSLGFVVGVAADPLTYLSFGTSRLAKVGGKLARVGKGRYALKPGTEVATAAGRKFAKKQVGELLPTDPEGLIKLADAPMDMQKASAAIVREEAVDRIQERMAKRLAKAKGVDVRSRASIAKAIRTGDTSALKGSNKFELQKAFGYDVRGRDFDSILKKAVDDEVSAITKAGVDPTSAAGAKLANHLGLVAIEQAEKRLLAAAKHAPGLLRTAQGKGIYFMGRRLPGTAAAAVALGNGTAKVTSAIAKTAAAHPRGVTSAVFYAGQKMKGAFDALGGVFHRDFSTRKIAGYNLLKQAHVDTHQAMIAKIHHEIAESPVHKLKKEQFERVVRAVEAGPAQVAKLTDEVELESARFIRNKLDEWAVKEVELGLLTTDQLKNNYLAHFYRNNPDEISRVVRAWQKADVDRATVGRHAEERVFDTLDEAIEVSTKQNAANKNVPILEPEWDPVEILRRRGEKHADAVSFGSWYETVAREYGEELPFDIDHVLRMVQSAMPAAPRTLKELPKIERMVAEGGSKLEDVWRLSTAGKKEFMRQRMLKVGSKSELINTLNKYSDFTDHLPDGGSLLGKLSADGTPFVNFAIPALAGIDLPKSIADDLADASDRVLRSKELSGIVRNWNKANNFFKRWVTIYFPAFHFRNFYSNVAQSFLDIGVHAINPALHKHSVAVMLGRKTGKFGGRVMESRNGLKYTDEQISAMLDNHGILGDVEQLTEQVVGRGGEALRKRRGVAERAARVTAVGIENEARVALFIQHLRHGMSPDAAAAQVKKFLFDYGNLSRAEKDYFRKIIPFYTWTRKNIELQVRTLASQPGRQANLTRAFRGRDSENNKMTTWEAEALKLRLDSDGKTVRMLTGVDLPVKGLDLIWNGSVRKTFNQYVGMISPLLKAPIEMSADKNLFTGRGLSRTESNGIGRVIEHMPASIKNTLGWKKDVNQVTGKPRYSFDGARFYLLAQSWAFSRFVSTSNRAFKQYLDNDQLGAFLLDVTTGLRFKDMNMSQEQYRRLVERRRQLEDVLTRRGVLVGFEKKFKPKKAGRLQ
jgi:hypothetical protein